MTQHNFSFYLFIIVLLFLDFTSRAQTDTAPILTATGDQYYCLKSQMNIATDFNIVDPDDTEIKAIYVQISTGYVRNEDTLILTGTHTSLSTSWSSSEGKLTIKSSLGGNALYTDLIAAVKDVIFESSSISPSNDKSFSITISDANYLPSTGHFYEYVANLGITWTAAKIAAENRNYYGLQGYLATITSYQETQLAGEQVAGAGWIGGSDSGNEGVWRWVTGPEAGQSFWLGDENGTTNGTDIPYANWNAPNEPNNAGGSGEDYAHIVHPNLPNVSIGEWNDLDNDGHPDGGNNYYEPKGYVVEYGGTVGDPMLNISASTTIKMTSITSVSGNNICGSGTTSLSATSNNGNVLWFESGTSTTPIGNGNTFTTPTLTSTKTFYALASANGCTKGIRSGVTAIVYTIPTITSATDTTICTSGTGTLSATSSSGIINWYDSLTGGNIVGSGSTYTTPNLTTTTTYYIDATENGCTTLERKTITIVVVHAEKPTTTNPVQYFCDTENTSLEDLTITGTDILWYASSSGGAPLINTKKLKNNTTYFASQTINTCESTERLPIKAVLFETPTPLAEIPKLGMCDSNSFGNDTDSIEYFNLTDNDTFILNGKNTGDYTIYYYLDNTLNTEITNPTNFKNTIANNPQTIYFNIENKNLTKCTASGSFEIEVHTLPVLITSEITLKQCDDDESNDGFSVFNLNEANELISSNYSNETFEFYRDPTFLDLIENPIAYNNPSVINSAVYVKIKTINNCERTAKINLKVGATQIPPNFHLQYYSCENQPSNDQDGRVFFNFSDAEQKLIDTKPIFSSQEVRITYFENLEDALSEINAIPDISNYQNTNSWEQKIYIRIDSDDVNACLGLNHVITLNVEPLPVANPVTIERQCDDDKDGIFPFEISAIDETVRNGQINIIISYFDENGTELPSPLPNPFLTKSQTITIKVENETSTTSPACFDKTSLKFIVDDAPEVFPVFIQPHCDDGEDTTDGFSSFDTSTIESSLLGRQTNMDVFYFDAENNPLPSPLPFPFFTDTQEITVLIENPLNTSCNVSTVLNFVVNPLPSFEVESEQILCLNIPPTILESINPKDDYTYQWFDNNGNIIGTEISYPTFEGGLFTVIATSHLGCESLSKTIFVEESNVATIGLNDVIIVDDSSNNTITINDTDNNLGDDDYEYSLNNEFGFYQMEPYFEQVPAGIHTLFVRDTDNCGTTSLEISVIGYPKFFTPNNDGFNDTWNIIGINQNFYPNSLLYIFDRFGKLLAQINPNSQGWNGIYNNKELPSSDYWFTVQLTDPNGEIRIKKGHFSLIRR